MGCEVGTDSGWKGQPMEVRRWAFGMKEQGWDHKVAWIEGTDNSYTVPLEIKNSYLYGLSGIGALILDGVALICDKDKNGKVDDDAWFMDDDNDGKIDEDPKDDDFDEKIDEDEKDNKDNDGDGKTDEDPKEGIDNDKDGKIDEDRPWPNVLDRRARTALAWGRDTETGKSRYFFLIVVEENMESPGWTWDETVSFCKDEIPKLVSKFYPKIKISTCCAVMLDGGSSVKFLWRHARKSGSPSEENRPEPEGYQSTDDEVTTYVMAWAECWFCQYCDK